VQIKCVSVLPTNDQANFLGKGKHYFPGKMEFGLIEGKEYIVFGLCILDGAGWVEILDETESFVYLVPLCLFEILDGSVSKYWITKVNENNNILIWPQIFYKPFFHDQLTDGFAEYVKDFEIIKRLIIDECNKIDRGGG
jgi:hypothetical protein